MNIRTVLAAASSLGFAASVVGAASPQDAVLQRCMGYLRSTGKPESTPNEFYNVCSTESQVVPSQNVSSQTVPPPSSGSTTGTGGELDDGIAAYTRRDFVTATRYLLPLAKSGQPVAENLVGLMYAQGQYLPQDYAQALLWFRKAAEEGNAAAQNNLGKMYFQGLGVRQDIVQAEILFKKAAAQGDLDAQKFLATQGARDTQAATQAVVDNESTDVDSAIIHYNGPIYMDNDSRVPPINIPSGYTGLVRCSNIDATCRLVSEEPMKAPVPCDKPPFGDPPEVPLNDGQENMAKALKANIPTMSLAQARTEMRKALSKACEAKYHGAARADFYSVGIADHDFDTQMVFTLASQYITMEIAHSAKGREQQAEIDARLAAATAAAGPPSSTTDNRPMIYAAVVCSSGGCQAYGESHITGPNSQEMTPFRSLAECQAYIRSASSGGTIGSDGRIKVAPGMWWECRGKHIDSWETVP